MFETAQQFEFTLELAQVVRAFAIRRRGQKLFDGDLACALQRTADVDDAAATPRQNAVNPVALTQNGGRPKFQGYPRKKTSRISFRIEKPPLPDCAAFEAPFSLLFNPSDVSTSTALTNVSWSSMMAW